MIAFIIGVLVKRKINLPLEADYEIIIKLLSHWLNMVTDRDIYISNSSKLVFWIAGYLMPAWKSGSELCYAAPSHAEHRMLCNAAPSRAEYWNNFNVSPFWFQMETDN